MLTVTNVLLALNFFALLLILRSLRALAPGRSLRPLPEPEMVIGFGPAVIPPGETATFNAEPKFEFSGQRLIVPSSFASAFNIVDLQVDGESQAVSAHPIPAAAFSELAVGVNLGLKKAAKGKTITLLVANATDKPQSFSAALIGSVPIADIEREAREASSEKTVAA